MLGLNVSCSWSDAGHRCLPFSPPVRTCLQFGSHGKFQRPHCSSMPIEVYYLALSPIPGREKELLPGYFVSWLFANPPEFERCPHTLVNFEVNNQSTGPTDDAPYPFVCGPVTYTVCTLGIGVKRERAYHVLIAINTCDSFLKCNFHISSG